MLWEIESSQPESDEECRTEIHGPSLCPTHTHTHTFNPERYIQMLNVEKTLVKRNLFLSVLIDK